MAKVDPWASVGLHVVTELERFDESINKLNEGLHALDKKVGLLQYKCSLLGVVAGAVPGVIAAIILVVGKVGS